MATANPTVPFPLPVEPDVTVIHGALLLAVHVHPVAVVTFEVPDPPSAGTVWLDGAIEYVQGAETPTCVTVNVCPAMVSVPVRSAPVFASTVNATGPFPLPVAPDVTAIHGALLVAVHVQPAAVVTFEFPVPPDAGTL